MSAVYDKAGIRFMYPENWTIAEEDLRQEPRTVTVQNESGAFWSLAVYDQPVDAAQIASTALTALRDVYDDFESEPISQQIAGVDTSGYDAHFYVEQLVAAACIRVFRHNGDTCLMLCQAEDREFDRLKPVFEAMLHSLLRELDEG